MIITTTETINGKTLEHLGVVKGGTVQAKHVGKDLMAGFKNIVGGELKGYTEMLQESREIAQQRMISEAHVLGADAIVAMRFASAGIMDGAAEVIAYGTAVKFI